MVNPARLLTLLLLSLLLAACSGKEDPEQQIRDWVAKGVKAVEAREVLQVAGLLDDDYLDPRGMDKKGALRVIAAYILRNKSIYLFTQTRDIEFPEPDRASVVVYVAMAAQPFTGEETLLSLRADLNRFKIELRRDGDDWLATSAEWRQVTQADMLDF